MPTYEYVCKACGKPHEHFASMSAKPLKKCPACGKNRLERQIGTGAGFIFKGGGFYETDYRSEGYKKAAKEDKASSDAKPEKAESSQKAGKDGTADKPAPPAAEKKPQAKAPPAEKKAPKKPSADS